MFCLTKVMLRRFSHCVFIHLNQLLAYHVWSHRVMMLVMMLPMQDKHKAGFWTRIMDDFAKGVACDSTFWLSMFTSRKWHERGEPREFRSFRIQTNKTSFETKIQQISLSKKNEIFVKEISLWKARGEARELPYRSGPNKPVVGNPETAGSVFFEIFFKKNKL